MEKHSIRHEMFADDSQLNHSESPENYSDFVRSLQDCVKDIGLWMEENKLKLNNDKTEAIRFSSSSSISTTLPHPQKISLSNTDVEFSGTVRNLGFIFDSDLSVKQHIIKTCKAAYLEIRRISSIRQLYLTEDATKTLANPCILSRLDYCNSLLVGYPQMVIKPLQQVQNSAAKLILNSRRAEHAKPLLKQLHWLPIEQIIKYKIVCLCHQIITGTAPQYLAELVQIYIPSRSLRSSSDDRTFRIPFFKRKQHGGRAFCFSAVQMWNSLPFALRHSPSLPVFKTSLKTYLFKQYFDQ